MADGRRPFCDPYFELFARGEVAPLKDTTDKNAKDKYERTPLHLASYSGHFASVKLLLESQADKNAKDIKKDIFGNPPLYWASCIDCVRLLLES
jgi:ankyrin repeat protein